MIQVEIALLLSCVANRALLREAARRRDGALWRSRIASLRRGGGPNHGTLRFRGGRL